MKPFFSKLLLCQLAFFLTGCTVGFANNRIATDENYARLYFPSAIDNSISAGNSSRLSYAVRQELSKHSDITLTSLNQARLALTMKIINRKVEILSVDSCKNPGTPTVGNGSFNCSLIHPEQVSGSSQAPSSFSQPSISPSQESIGLVISAKLIDLNDGKVLWAKTYDLKNTPSYVFNEIGDSGDNRTIVNMAKVPQLHGLRHQEAIEHGVAQFSKQIAQDIVENIYKSINH